ncbi:MAG: hypothetical protein AB7T63_11045 [Planctomycetota bacterium]
MTKEEQADLYFLHLVEEGYAPQIDKDGDVVFKYEGGTWFLQIDERDPEFFRLVFPNFWSIESDDERERVERAALKATADTKVAKVFPVREDTWASVEMFVSPPEGFRPVFRRCLAAVGAAVAAFRREMTSADAE